MRSIRFQESVLLEKLLVDVGPKFLNDIADPIIDQLARPPFKSLAGGACFARVITTGDFG
jgi:hypothetical protein